MSSENDKRVIATLRAAANDSMHNTPAKCSVNIYEVLDRKQFDDVSAILDMDFEVFAQNEKIPCKKVIVNEKQADIFWLLKKNHIEYSINLIAGKDGQQYESFIGCGDYLTARSKMDRGFLHAGLSCIAEPVNWFGRGAVDLLVSCESDDRFYQSVVLYKYLCHENGVPTYREGVKLSFLQGLVKPVVKSNGMFDLLGIERSDQGTYTICYYVNAGVEGKPAFKEKKIVSEGLNTFHGDVHQIEILYDCDKFDILAAVNNMDEYYPDGINPRLVNSDTQYVPYDGNGRWRGGAMKGYIYRIRNSGTYADPRFENAGIVSDFEIYGCYGVAINESSKSSGPGNMDGSIILSDIINGLYLSCIDENKKCYSNIARLKNTCNDDISLDNYFYSISNVTYQDEDEGGLILGSEEGYLYYMKRNGYTQSNMPLFDEPRRILQQRPRITAGIAVSPYFTEWKDIHDKDLFIGTAAGEIAYIKKWNAFDQKEIEFCTINGEKIKIEAGLTGSIQGPHERKWGYAGILAFDFNGDGLNDLVSCDISGRHLLYLNKNKTIDFDRSLDMMTDGKPLYGAWRCRGTAYRENSGRLVYICIDENGRLVYYYQLNSVSPEVFGSKNYFHYEDGNEIVLDGFSGMSGRIKIELVRKNGGSNMEDSDILFGTKGGQNQDFNPHSKSSLFILERTKDRNVFKRPRQIKDHFGKPMFFGSHDPSPQICDIDSDGVDELIVGAENGYIYVYKYVDGKITGTAEAAVIKA